MTGQTLLLCRVSSKSHLIAFAAEEFGVTGNMIDMGDYVNQLKDSALTV